MNFYSFSDACDFFAVDTSTQLEAAMIAHYALERDRAMDDMEGHGMSLYAPRPDTDLCDEIPY